MIPSARLLLALLASGSAGAAPQQFLIEPAATHVHWEIRHFGTSTSRGRFDAVGGSITLDREARRGNASIAIQTGSISTGLALFDAVLRGPYLLSTEAHPAAYFVTSRFVFDGDRVTAVDGVLTLRDTASALTLRAQRFACRTDNAEPPREVCGGDFEAEFNRSLFGITHSLPFVADKVRVIVQIEAVRQ